MKKDDYLIMDTKNESNYNYIQCPKISGYYDGVTSYLDIPELKNNNKNYLNTYGIIYTLYLDQKFINITGNIDINIFNITYYNSCDGKHLFLKTRIKSISEYHGSFPNKLIYDFKNINDGFYMFFKSKKDLAKFKLIY